MHHIKLIIFTILLIAAGLGLYFFTHIDDLQGCDVSPGVESPCQKADAIVAISGGDTAARARMAIELYEKGWADKIIFSGAARDTTGPSNAKAMRHQALAAGVRPQDIYTDEFAQNTSQNALGVLEVAKVYALRDIILVTSPYHQARASAMFHKAFAGYGTVRNHSTPYDKSWSDMWWLTPRGWYTITTELVGTATERFIL